MTSVPRPPTEEMLSTTRIGDICAFWFDQLTHKEWFTGGQPVDDAIKAQFGDLIDPALRGELWHWRETALGRVAELLILDQFTRNCFRGTAKAFAGDKAALVLAQEAVAQGAHTALSKDQQHFAFMPFMHAESSRIHAAYRRLFTGEGFEDTLRFYDQHADVVAQFGRYPSRNNALGRTSTPDELAFMKDGPRWGQ